MDGQRTVARRRASKRGVHGTAGFAWRWPTVRRGRALSSANDEVTGRESCGESNKESVEGVVGWRLSSKRKKPRGTEHFLGHPVKAPYVGTESILHSRVRVTQESKAITSVYKSSVCTPRLACILRSAFEHS